MTTASSSARRIAIRILRVFLGLAFLVIGTAKLTGTMNTVQTFDAFGWGQWFRYVSGMLDVAGALLVLVPQLAFYGALVLTGTVGLATVLSVSRPDVWPALVLTILAASLAWLTRPGARSRSSDAGIGAGAA